MAFVDFSSLMPIFVAAGVAIIIIITVIIIHKIRNKPKIEEKDPNAEFYKPYEN